MSQPSPPDRPPDLDPSTSLLQGVQCGSAVAWSRLVRLCAPVVARWCRRSGFQPADTDDVLQEVFRAVARAIQRFRKEHDGSFAAWLHEITRNKINDHLRRQQANPPAVGGSSAQQQLQQVPAPEDSSSSGNAPVPASVLLLRRALDLVRPEFEETTWLAFWRSAAEEKDTEMIAQELGLSPNAVRVAKFRVLARLREELGDLLE